MATFRKWGCKRSKIAEYFGLSSLGEVIVIGVYWVANLILVVCGAAGSIDFMAHVGILSMTIKTLFERRD